MTIGFQKLKLITKIIMTFIYLFLQQNSGYYGNKKIMQTFQITYFFIKFLHSKDIIGHYWSDNLKKKYCIQKILNLSTCADNSTNIKINPTPNKIMCHLTLRLIDWIGIRADWWKMLFNTLNKGRHGTDLSPGPTNVVAIVKTKSLKPK